MIHLHLGHYRIRGRAEIKVCPQFASRVSLVTPKFLSVTSANSQANFVRLCESDMASKEENRIFVGGLSWDVTERQLENAFNRYGKIIECQVMLERDTGRPRGFGFITFADRRAMDDAIREMHGREFGDRVISVNKAQPKMGGDDLDHGYRGSYSTSGGRGGGYGGDRPLGQDECFKCGRLGHWARDCPSSGGRGAGGGSFSSRSRFPAGDRSDRFGSDRDRYMDDRYDGGRYGDRDRFDARDKYGNRDRYANDRYPPSGDRFGSERYGGSDRYAHNGYGKDRAYDRDGIGRGGNDRYASGGPARNDRGYRNRPVPYDRPSRGGHPSSFERY